MAKPDTSMEVPPHFEAESCDCIIPGLCVMLNGSSQIVYEGPIKEVTRKPEIEQQGNRMLLNPVDYDDLVAFVNSNRH